MGENFKLKKIHSFIISCDGGAASGKTTGAKLIAKKYNLKFLSSGKLYRYAGYLLLKNKPKNKVNFLKKKFANLNLSKLRNINLHSQKVSEYTSEIAKNNKIRTILKSFQIKFSKKYRKCIIEGRDISTKILPTSDVKFYFKCNLDIAARRRYLELKKKKYKITFTEVKKSLKMRDSSDKKRKHSPLLKHIDALEIDTGKLGISAMVNKMSRAVNGEIKHKYGSRTKSR